MRTAIVFDNDQILRHVDQTTGQVTRVRRLQCRIGQTFTGTVSRDEVLQNVQAFTEVCGNRRFNDRSVRFGHQATHACQLANLCRRTTSARVSHHINGVEGFLRAGRTITFDDVLNFQLIHHGLPDGITCFAPDIDNLVISFASGNQTGSVLLFNLFDFLFSC